MRISDVEIISTLTLSSPRVLKSTAETPERGRREVVDRCHSKMKRYRNLVSYYTNKNISVSYLRAKKQQDTDRVLSLYGTDNERYW